MVGTLGILLTTSPESADLRTAIRLARAARSQGRDARFFVMCDGVYALWEESLQRLAAEGAQIFVCGVNAEQRHVAEIEGVPNLRWGSQYDFARITAECDRVIAFN